MKSVTLFCVNMRLNNTINAYAVFSQKFGASAQHQNVSAYITRLPEHWNSPVSMAPLCTLYGRLILKVFTVLKDYGKREFKDL